MNSDKKIARSETVWNWNILRWCSENCLIKRATNKEGNTVESESDLVNNLIQLDCHNKLPKSCTILTQNLQRYKVTITVSMVIKTIWNRVQGIVSDIQGTPTPFLP